MLGKNKLVLLVSCSVWTNIACNKTLYIDTFHLFVLSFLCELLEFNLSSEQLNTNWRDIKAAFHFALASEFWPNKRLLVLNDTGTLKGLPSISLKAIILAGKEDGEVRK